MREDFVVVRRTLFGVLCFVFVVRSVRVSSVCFRMRLILFAFEFVCILVVGFDVARSAVFVVQCLCFCIGV